MKRLLYLLSVLVFLGIFAVNFAAYKVYAHDDDHHHPKPTPRPTPSPKLSACTEVENQLATCNTNLGNCNSDLNTCNNALANCEVQPSQVFPGEGYANPDSFGVSGRGPSLSYTDNSDGTFTDNNTRLMWEKKLAADDVGGGNCADATQAIRSVRCVNNRYTWD